jgi:RHS repeat-associated protein
VYDRSSNLATLTDPSGTVDYGYDDIDRVTSIVAPAATGSGTDTVTYAYADTPTPADPTTKVTATYPGGATQRIDRNASGRPTAIVAKNSGGTVLSSRTYAYTDASSTKRALIQSVTDEALAKTTYTYKDATAGEDVGRLLKARTETSGGALIEEFAYLYDEAGNRTRITRSIPSLTLVSTFAYNQANQLCWRRSGIWSNPCGSPPPSTVPFSYDGAGNQVAGDQGTQSMSFDQLGRVSAIGGTAVQSFGASNNELKSHGSSSFHNTLLGLSRQVDGANVTSIVRHPETGLPVSEVQGGVKRFFVQDAIGSTTATLNAASGGSLARRFTYTPDGDDTFTGSGPVTNQRFAGGHRLLNTKLYHFGARYYDLFNARWTQLDPLNQVGELREANRYVYAGGDPVNLIDLTGGDSVCGTPTIEGNTPNCSYDGGFDSDRAKRVGKGCAYGAIGAGLGGERSVTLTKTIPPGVAIVGGCILGAGIAGSKGE